MNTTHVVLRQTNDVDGLRWLEASINADGDVVIAGQDLGDGVEAALGFREYEWIWTIPARGVPALLAALGTDDNPLSALADHFSGDNAAQLGAFLESNAIPTERWSRIGD